MQRLARRLRYFKKHTIGIDNICGRCSVCRKDGTRTKDVAGSRALSGRLKRRADHKGSQEASDAKGHCSLLILVLRALDRPHGR